MSKINTYLLILTQFFLHSLKGGFSFIRLIEVPLIRKEAISLSSYYVPLLRIVMVSNKLYREHLWLIIRSAGLFVP